MDACVRFFPFLYHDMFTIKSKGTRKSSGAFFRGTSTSGATVSIDRTELLCTYHPVHLNIVLPLMHMCICVCLLISSCHFSLELPGIDCDMPDIPHHKISPLRR